MLRRELLLVFRSRVTWMAATLAALLAGHGFVLAVDIFSSASRSALASVLMRREMDPLAGVVRPTLGGLELATALLVPLIAARTLAIDKERGGFGAVLLQAGSAVRLVRAKVGAAFAGAALLLVPAIALLLAFAMLGGHLDAIETATALGGHALHVVLVASVSLAAAALTDTVAAAVTLALVVSLGSWAVDASEGFAAVAWLAPLARLSLSTRIAPFEHGILSLEQVAAFSAMIGGALALAVVVLVRPRLRQVVLVVLVTAIALLASTRARRSFDWSEQRRASLPPETVSALREIRQPIRIEVWLDPEDSRRKELEADTLAKLALARGDLEVTTAADVRSDYGKLVIRVGDTETTTRSTSRGEIVTLIFETAKRPQPSARQPEYAGYPTVIEGSKRFWLGAFAYVIFPGAFVVLGLVITRTKRRIE